MSFKGEAKLIEDAQKQYAASMGIFESAKDKIDKANSALEQSIQAINNKIDELIILKNRALEDQARNQQISQKLDEFLVD